MVTVLKQVMTNNDSSVTLFDVKIANRILFASLKQANRNTRNRQHESALYARSNPGRTCKTVFKGHWRTCGQKGHKSTDCWKQLLNKDKRPAN
jgi:hypothetical protein